MVETSVRESLRGVGRDLVGSSRLLLGAKTAIAAALAWYFAPFIPLAETEYSYYAPLGVLVSMYPTFFESARAGFQALLGLGVGVALGAGGLVLVRITLPAVISVALVVGLGVVLGGIRSLGAGREWIPIAGLFVLLLGGSEASEFSISYLVTMAFGVLVGLAVHFITIPPLFGDGVDRSVRQAQSSLAETLEELGEFMRGKATDQAVSRSLAKLRTSLASAEQAARDDRNSERANPRARRHRRQGRAAERQVGLLSRAEAIADMLADVLRDESEQEGALQHGETRELISEALDATSTVVRAPEESSAGALPAELARLRSAVSGDNVSSQVNVPQAQQTLLGTVDASLRQLIHTVQPHAELDVRTQSRSFQTPPRESPPPLASRRLPRSQ